MLKWLSIHVVMVIALISCESVLHQTIGDGGTESDTLTVEIDPNDTLPTAICLWERVGLREGPGRNKDIKYITTILMGEKVYMLGDTQKVATENRTYIKVRLSDGQEGWVHQYLFGLDAKLGAVKESTSIFRRPDPMMLKTDKFEAGEFVAVVDEQEDWVKVLGWQKKKVGWIKKDNNITEDLEDVKVVVLYQRAIHERQLDKKIDMLKTILENSDSDSRFLEMVKTDLNESTVQLKDRKINENQVRVTVQRAELRSKPNNSDDNVLTNLEVGTVCDVLSIWPPDSMRNTLNMEEWVEVEHKGKQGWIYGALTSVVSKK